MHAGQASSQAQEKGKTKTEISRCLEARDALEEMEAKRMEELTERLRKKSQDLRKMRENLEKEERDLMRKKSEKQDKQASEL